MERDLELWKQKLTQTFAYFIDFCERHQLRYYCCAGTALGAVRHQGFIPWDDDIDVDMPRPDYDRLVELQGEFAKDGYELSLPTVENDYPLSYAKLSDTHTTLLERPDLRYITGAFIDIFPLDGCNDDAEIAKKEYEQCWEWRQRLQLTVQTFSLKEIALKALRGHPVSAAKAFLYGKCFPRWHRRRLLNRLKRQDGKYDFDQSEFVVCNHGYRGIARERIPRQWIGKGAVGSFEGMKVVLFEDYEAWLTHFFGDYMQLPPESERTTHHWVSYINMEKRETLAEVLEKVGRRNG